MCCAVWAAGHGKEWAGGENTLRTWEVQNYVEKRMRGAVGSCSLCRIVWLNRHINLESWKASSTVDRKEGGREHQSLSWMKRDRNMRIGNVLWETASCSGIPVGPEHYFSNHLFISCFLFRALSSWWRIGIWEAKDKCYAYWIPIALLHNCSMSLTSQLWTLVNLEFLLSFISFMHVGLLSCSRWASGLAWPTASYLQSLGQVVSSASGDKCAAMVPR